jgi:hypothetical protein
MKVLVISSENLNYPQNKKMIIKFHNHFKKKIGKNDDEIEYKLCKEEHFPYCLKETNEKFDIIWCADKNIFKMIINSEEIVKQIYNNLSDNGIFFFTESPEFISKYILKDNLMISYGQLATYLKILPDKKIIEEYFTEIIYNEMIFYKKNDYLNNTKYGIEKTQNKGDCFFSSLFRSLLKNNFYDDFKNKIVTFFGIDIPDKPTDCDFNKTDYCCIAEKEFILQIRQLLSNNINIENYIQSLNFMNSLSNKENENISRDSYSDMQKKILSNKDMLNGLSSDKLRRDKISEIVKTELETLNKYVGEIEVDLMKNTLKIMGYQLHIITENAFNSGLNDRNTKIKKDLNKKQIYMINTGNHYQYIIKKEDGKRKSLRRKSLRRKSLKRKSLRKSLRRKSLRRKSLRRKSLRRKSLRRKSLRRKSLKRKSLRRKF